MKLSKLYSNQPDIFTPIYFEQGLNVILAEIRLPENKKKDTHNLGKTTLGRLLDFVFLAKRDPKFFLFKQEFLFKDFVFFLEIHLASDSYVTVCRSVAAASKISFKKHTKGQQDYSDTTTEWDHLDLPFERAVEMLDSLLDLRALKPWSFRQGLGYQLRSQNDFQDVFQLKKFFSHADWKPFLAHILGFDASLVDAHYQKERQLEEKVSTSKTIKDELGGSIEDISKIEGLLLLKRQDVEKKQKLLDAFDFCQHDKDKTKQLVDDIDQRLATLNAERYSLSLNEKKIQSSLKEEAILFDTEEATSLFKEAGIFFGGQIKKDFEQLLAFNRAITDERRAYLQEELQEIQTRLTEINQEITILSKQRSETLAFLGSTDVFAKYKQISDEMVLLRADTTTLERQREFLHRLQSLRTEIRTLEEQRNHLQTQIESDIEEQNANPHSLFSSIRLFFSEIVEEVIDRKALLSVSPNKEGHLEFKAEILDGTGSATSADDGHTYKKLLCIAFDLAVLRAHCNEQYPRFVYHDGVFESLDGRKKTNLLQVIRQYAAFGIQPIITLIDTDMPEAPQANTTAFDKKEVVLRLHDEGEQGLLFKMPSW